MRILTKPITPLLCLMLGVTACDPASRPTAGAAGDDGSFPSECSDLEPDQPEPDEPGRVPPDTSDGECSPLPDDPTQVSEVMGTIDLDQGIDGLRYVGAVEFETGAGRGGVFHMEVTPDGSTDVTWEIDGVLVGTTHYDVTTDSITQWTAPDLDPDASLTLVSRNVIEAATANVIATNGAAPVPVFDCSDFGKQAVKGFKYALYGLIGAGMAACCVGGVGVGCIVCAGVGTAGMGAAGDALDEYCD